MKKSVDRASASSDGTGVALFCILTSQSAKVQQISGQSLNTEQMHLLLNEALLSQDGRTFSQLFQNELSMRCAMVDGHSVFFPQLHDSGDIKWFNAILTSQFELARFIISHNEFEIFEEGQYEEYNQNSLRAHKKRGTKEGLLWSPLLQYRLHGIFQT